MWSLVIPILFFSSCGCSNAYFADWGLLGGRPSQPTCVDIPKNLTLCNGIGYTKMRLPNLLEHDTMAEVSQQAASWVPLSNVDCNPDTTLFLCSLFSPVCLDRPIYPCRSLCETVREGCSQVMTNYGYSWPDMFRCDKFPEDNDMCIRPQFRENNVQGGEPEDCKICEPVNTYENILNNYCMSDFVVKTKVRRVGKSKIKCKKAKIYKNSITEKQLSRQVRRPRLKMTSSSQCCQRIVKPNLRYLIMGKMEGGDMEPTFVMPWGQVAREFKKAIHTFQHLDCSDPEVVSILTDPERLNSRTRRQKQRRSRHSRRRFDGRSEP